MPNQHIFYLPMNTAVMMHARVCGSDHLPDVQGQLRKVLESHSERISQFMAIIGDMCMPRQRARWA